MPRLRKSREEITDEKFNTLLRRHIHGSAYETISAVAGKIGLGERCFGKKLRNPEDLKISELRELYDIGIISADEVAELITRETRAKEAGQ